MHRRKFLGTVTIGAGFTALPMWLSRAFGPQQGACPEPAPAPMSDALPPPRLACQPNTAPFKPLLILVIPAEREHQYRRGQAFGELINHGSDEQLAALACFEVRCSRVDQLGPGLREQLTEEPLMLVLDHSAAPSLLPLTARLVYMEDGPQRWTHDDWEETERLQEAAIDARIAALAGLIAGAADGSRLAAQACRERQGLPDADLQRLDELPQSLGELGPRDLDRAPALGLLAARDGEREQRDHLHTLLAASVRARLCDSPVPGAPWARTRGCGVTVEGAARQSRVACGMGSVPARSSRFLMFYGHDDE